MMKPLFVIALIVLLISTATSGRSRSRNRSIHRRSRATQITYVFPADSHAIRETSSNRYSSIGSIGYQPPPPVQRWFNRSQSQFNHDRYDNRNANQYRNYDNQCATDVIESCFRRLYRSLTCLSDSEPYLKCRDYLFINECGTQHFDRCSTQSIAEIWHQIHNQVAARGDKPQWCMRRDLELYKLQASLSQLQFDCIRPRYRCSPDIVSDCETALRQVDDAQPYGTRSVLKTHRKLRNRLNNITRPRQSDSASECKRVRHTLNSLSNIHYTHCYSAQVTKCLCQELSMSSECADIECNAFVHKTNA